MKTQVTIFEDVKTDPNFRVGFEASLRSANRDTQITSPVMNLQDCLVTISRTLKIPQVEVTSIAVNLSHTQMDHFDFPKLALLGGDEQFSEDVHRHHRNPVPILRCVYDGLVALKEGRPAKLAASDLLKLKGWDARRVMYNLSTNIPINDHTGIDFGPMIGANPHIQFRLSGGIRYEELAKLLIRYAALVKIACDPGIGGDEFLKKLKNLAESRTPQPNNQMPRIWIFLQPIMSRITREMLTRIDTHQKSGKNVPEGAFMFLAILRSSLDMSMASNMRVRQGLNMLRSTMGLTTDELIKSLRQTNLLRKYGIIRMTEPFSHTQAMLHNTVKTLNLPVTKQTLFQSALERSRQHQGNIVQEEQRRRRRKRRLLEQEIARRKKDKKDKLKAAELARQRLQLMDDEQDQSPQAS